MQHEIYTRLAPVRTRHQNRETLRAAGNGLLLGAAIAVLLSLAACAARARGVDWRLSLVVLPGGAAAAAIVGLAAGFRAGRRRGLSWEATAALVDAHDRLQDQTLTALGFADKASRTELRPLEAAHLAKALTDLGRVDPRSLVPIGSPKSMALAVALLAVAVAISGWSIYTGPPEDRSPQTAGESVAEVQPPEGKSPATAPSQHAPSRAQVRWRLAGSGRVTATRASSSGNVPLEQVVSEAERTPRVSEAIAPRAKDIAAPPGTAVEGESIPPEYRQIIHRYFGAIRLTDTPSQSGRWPGRTGEEEKSF